MTKSRDLFISQCADCLKRVSLPFKCLFASEQELSHSAATGNQACVVSDSFLIDIYVAARGMPRPDWTGSSFTRQLYIYDPDRDSQFEQSELVPSDRDIDWVTCFRCSYVCETAQTLLFVDSRDGTRSGNCDPIVYCDTDMTSLAVVSRRQTKIGLRNVISEEIDVSLLIYSEREVSGSTQLL
jgi:hypothetical protein